MWFANQSEVYSDLVCRAGRGALVGTNEMWEEVITMDVIHQIIAADKGVL